MELYILDEYKNPIPEPDRNKWENWFLENNPLINYDEFCGIKISTIFFGEILGEKNKKPLLFKTIIRGGDLDGFQKLYSSFRQAKKGHEKVIDLVLKDSKIHKKLFEEILNKKITNNFQKSKMTKKELEAISPQELKNYLISKGWQSVEAIGDKALIFQKKGDALELILPLRKDLGDFAIRMAELLSALSSAEDRFWFEIIDDATKKEI